MVERNVTDSSFIVEHTDDWDGLAAHLATLSYDVLLDEAGLTMQQLDAFVDEYARADSAILLWSMGITQHRRAGEGVRGIVNLALARGNIGRTGAGLMPLRGHSGVQGGAEMGAYATALPGGIALDSDSAAAVAEQWGFAPPQTTGLTAEEMVEAAGDGRIEVLYSSGGNFLETLPDPALVAGRLDHLLG